MATLLTKKAVERAVVSKLEDARDAVLHKVQEILAAYRREFAPGLQQGSLACARALDCLPLLMLGLVKHVALRPGVSVHPDVRAAALADLYMLAPDALLPQICPRFYNLLYDVGASVILCVLGSRN